MLKRPLSATFVLAAVVAVAAAAFAPPALADEQSRNSPAPLALVDFSLEQLSDVLVTSVSRQETRLLEAPASIYLISGADIRRSGATSLPEALRLAPNLQVAQSGSHSWAITARGFNSTLENKLLVLIDGRSIYSPLFSGVFWDSQGVLMEDIDRIEVISGAGATIWGANAVNGVINIITRNAAETQGTLATVSSGNQFDGGAARVGGALGNGGHYRVYAQYEQGDATSNEARTLGSGAWRRRQAGMRADWAGRTHDVTISADAYQGSFGNGALADAELAGANLLGRVNSRLADGSQLRLQAYLDHVERDQAGTAAQLLDTVDLEAQHSVRLGDMHNMTWGGGYRLLRDRVRNGPLLQFSPNERSSSLSNVFGQDELLLRPALRLTVGVKFEHNAYTDWEVLPSARLGWNVSDSQLLWTSLSRTVRTPSRIDRDLRVRSAEDPTRYNIAGGPDFDAEVARVMEAGWRGQGSGAMASMRYSATLFYSDYERLRTLEPGSPLGPQFRNFGEGTARGIEMWGRWQVLAGWRLTGGLVLQKVRSGPTAGSQDASGATGLATNDPSNHWQLRSSHDLSAYLQADVALRHVGKLPSPAVPAYTELDVRLAWQPLDHVEVALAGQNLLRAGHVEFGAAGVAQRIERALSLKLGLRF